MPISQSELPLNDPGLPDNLEAGAAWLAAFLMAHPKGPGRGGAWPARSICRHLGKPFSEANRRRLRAFREAAGRNIVSGPNGYQHVRCADLETREIAARIRLSSARKMSREAIAELRALSAAKALISQI